MSAFIVSKGCMTNVVLGLRLAKVEIKDHDTLTAGGLTKLGRNLYKMNRKAILARYGRCSDGTEEIMTFEINSIPIEYSHLDLIQIIKSMRCFLYQCSEGNVWESKLFKQVDFASGEIAQGIVATLPEYGKARWN